MMYIDGTRKTAWRYSAITSCANPRYIQNLSAQLALECALVYQPRRTRRESRSCLTDTVCGGVMTRPAVHRSDSRVQVVASEGDSEDLVS